MSILLFITFLSLATASLLLWLFVERQRRVLLRVGSALLYLGFGVWTLELVLRYISYSTLPVYDLSSSLFFWGWCGLLIFTAFNSRFKLSVFSFLFVGCASLLIILSALTATPKAPISPYLKGLWFHLHVVTVFLGIGMFLISSTAAFLYLWVDHLLKKKRLSHMRFKLPSLAIIDNMGHYSITLGFFFYTVGMLTGLIYSHASFGRYWQWDPKEVWSLLTWILYAILLHERLALGWRGKKASVLTLICFSALLFTFLGIGHMGRGYHSFKVFTGGP